MVHRMQPDDLHRWMSNLTKSNMKLLHSVVYLVNFNLLGELFNELVQLVFIVEILSRFGIARLVGLKVVRQQHNFLRVVEIIQLNQKVSITGNINGSLNISAIQTVPMSRHI